MFITTLRTAGHDVVAAKAALDEGVSDEQLLRYCVDDNRVLITHDKQHFSGPLSVTVDHPGIVIYTDANYLRDEPAAAVRTLERVRTVVPDRELRNQVIWLDEWRRGGSGP